MSNRTLDAFLGLPRAVAELRKEQAKARAEAKVDKAIAAGLLARTQRSWGIEHCAARPSSFETYLAIQAKDRQEQAEKQEKQICARMGVDHTAFVAAKAKRAQAK
jgi:hypothetical protein